MPSTGTGPEREKAKQRQPTCPLEKVPLRETVWMAPIGTEGLGLPVVTPPSNPNVRLVYGQGRPWDPDSHPQEASGGESLITLKPFLL